MTLENKLHITDDQKLADEEERLSKLRALELYDKKLLNTVEAGTFKGLQTIHKYLFQDIYEFAGKLRTVNMSKENFRFASCRYLEESLQQIDRMPQSTFNEIIEKYVEMNVAHPFREGNGRSSRIWLNTILKKEIHQVVDWSRVDKAAYLKVMEQSPVSDMELKRLLQGALTDRINDRKIYMEGIDASYQYEGFDRYRTSELILA
ncbi:MAG: Fic family protein [Acidaminococcus sp.]|jgi:cell filamentation protein|nr:Fic family protein [Acidaminococcus sp.]MCI2100281.1 Fic family protein [Acidaminococcus sp.]MCI2114643.1 Fic family protein [Acidaminococcus sp.]MCI2116578.1 Fic family protein [Acidaminococcus sp.]